MTMDSETLIDNYQKQINQRVVDFIRTYKSPQSLYEPMEYVLEGKGKRIRPVLLLLVNRSLNGNEESAYHAAVALEILHNFTLVHDDIMDQDIQRRGRPTVHTKWDLSTAILSGDGLLALAYRSLLAIQNEKIQRILQVFTDGVIDICEGQAYDKEFETRTDVDITEYSHMVSKKTGRLISMCCEIPAILAWASEDIISDYREFGYLIGEVFQIQDDILEITSTAEVTGKSLGSDIISKKKTYIFIKTMEVIQRKNLDDIKDLVNKKIQTEEDIKKIRKFVQDSGIITQAQQYVNEKLNKAYKLLDELNVETTHLKYFVRKLENRQS